MMIVIDGEIAIFLKIWYFIYFRIWDSVLTLRGTMPPKHQASIPHNSEASPKPHLLNHKIQKVATSIKGERKNYSYFTPYLLCEPPVSPWIEAVMPKENLGGGSFIASVGAVAPHNHPLLQILVMVLSIFSLENSFFVPKFLRSQSISF